MKTDRYTSARYTSRHNAVRRPAHRAFESIPFCEAFDKLREEVRADLIKAIEANTTGEKA